MREGRKSLIANILNEAGQTKAVTSSAAERNEVRNKKKEGGEGEEEGGERQRRKTEGNRKIGSKER